ncbi:MAG: hypothetical protein AAB569_05415 [Patescibacteria group bacterium]
MFNSQKVLSTIFVILFIITVSELFYVFYYQPSISKKTPLPIPIPSVSVKSNNVVRLPFVSDKKSAFQSGDQVKEIISESQTKKHDFFSYTDLLKALMVGNKQCLTQKDCFILDNAAEGWKGDIDKDFPITISRPFIARLNFSGDKGPSGISLYGRLSKSGRPWWQDIKNIFFGIGNDGKRLYIDAKNGEKKEAFFLYDNVFAKKIEGIYVLFNVTGTSFLVTDLSYNKIVFIDLNKATNNKFPQGIFPDKQFYIGYNIAPLSDLVVYDFSIL